MADDDHQRVRGRKSRCADGSDLAPGEPVAQLARRHGREEVREGWRGVELARSGQVRNPRRDRCAWSGGGNVHAVDRLVAELVDAEQPPQPVGGRAARQRRRRLRRGVEPRATVGLGAQSVDTGQGEQQQTDAEGNRGRGDDHA